MLQRPLHHILGPILPSLSRQALRGHFLCAPKTITSHSRPNSTISLARNSGAVFSVFQRPLYYILGPILPSLSLARHSGAVFFCAPKTTTSHSRPSSTISLSSGTQKPFFLCSKDHYITFSAQFYHFSLARHSGAVFSVLQISLHHIPGPILPSLSPFTLEPFPCAPKTSTLHSRPNSTISLTRHSGAVFSVLQRPLYHILGPILPSLSPGTQEPFFLCSKDHYITFSAQFYHLSHQALRSRFSMLQRPLHHILGPILPSLSRQALRGRFVLCSKDHYITFPAQFYHLSRHSLWSRFLVLQRPLHHILGPVLPSLSPGTQEPFFL